MINVCSVSVNKLRDTLGGVYRIVTEGNTVSEYYSALFSADIINRSLYNDRLYILDLKELEKSANNPNNPYYNHANILLNVIREGNEIVYKELKQYRYIPVDRVAVTDYFRDKAQVSDSEVNTVFSYLGIRPFSKEKIYHIGRFLRFAGNSQVFYSGIDDLYLPDAIYKDIVDNQYNIKIFTDKYTMAKNELDLDILVYDYEENNDITYKIEPVETKGKLSIRENIISLSLGKNNKKAKDKIPSNIAYRIEKDEKGKTYHLYILSDKVPVYGKTESIEDDDMKKAADVISNSSIYEYVRFAGKGELFNNYINNISNIFSNNKKDILTAKNKIQYKGDVTDKVFNILYNKNIKTLNDVTVNQNNYKILHSKITLGYVIKSLMTTKEDNANLMEVLKELYNQVIDELDVGYEKVLTKEEKEEMYNKNKQTIFKIIEAYSKYVKEGQSVSFLDILMIEGIDISDPNRISEMLEEKAEEALDELIKDIEKEKNIDFSEKSDEEIYKMQDERLQKMLAVKNTISAYKDLSESIYVSPEEDDFEKAMDSDEEGAVDEDSVGEDDVSGFELNMTNNIMDDVTLKTMSNLIHEEGRKLISSVMDIVARGRGAMLVNTELYDKYKQSSISGSNTDMYRYLYDKYISGKSIDNILDDNLNNSSLYLMLSMILTNNDLSEDSSNYMNIQLITLRSTINTIMPASLKGAILDTVGFNNRQMTISPNNLYRKSSLGDLMNIGRDVLELYNIMRYYMQDKNNSKLKKACVERLKNLITKLNEASYIKSSEESDIFYAHYILDNEDESLYKELERIAEPLLFKLYTTYYAANESGRLIANMSKKILTSDIYFFNLSGFALNMFTPVRLVNNKYSNNYIKQLFKDNKELKYNPDIEDSRFNILKGTDYFDSVYGFLLDHMDSVIGEGNIQVQQSLNNIRRIYRLFKEAYNELSDKLYDEYKNEQDKEAFYTKYYMHNYKDILEILSERPDEFKKFIRNYLSLYGVNVRIHMSMAAHIKTNAGELGKIFYEYAISKFYKKGTDGTKIDDGYYNGIYVKNIPNHIDNSNTGMLITILFPNTKDEKYNRIYGLMSNIAKKTDVDGKQGELSDETADKETSELYSDEDAQDEKADIHNVIVPSISNTYVQILNTFYKYITPRGLISFFPDGSKPNVIKEITPTYVASSINNRTHHFTSSNLVLHHALVNDYVVGVNQVVKGKQNAKSGLSHFADVMNYFASKGGGILSVTTGATSTLVTPILSAKGYNHAYIEKSIGDRNSAIGGVGLPFVLMSNFMAYDDSIMKKADYKNDDRQNALFGIDESSALWKDNMLFVREDRLSKWFGIDGLTVDESGKKATDTLGNLMSYISHNDKLQYDLLNYVRGYLFKNIADGLDKDESLNLDFTYSDVFNKIAKNIKSKKYKEIFKASNADLLDDKKFNFILNAGEIIAKAYINYLYGKDIKGLREELITNLKDVNKSEEANKILNELFNMSDEENRDKNAFILNILYESVFLLESIELKELKEEDYFAYLMTKYIKHKTGSLFNENANRMYSTINNIIDLMTGHPKEALAKFEFTDTSVKFIIKGKEYVVNNYSKDLDINQWLDDYMNFSMAVMKNAHIWEGWLDFIYYYKISVKIDNDGNVNLKSRDIYRFRVPEKHDDKALFGTSMMRLTDPLDEEGNNVLVGIMYDEQLKRYVGQFDDFNIFMSNLKDLYNGFSRRVNMADGRLSIPVVDKKDINVNFNNVNVVYDIKDADNKYINLSSLSRFNRIIHKENMNTIFTGMSYTIPRLYNKTNTNNLTELSKLLYELNNIYLSEYFIKVYHKSKGLIPADISKDMTGISDNALFKNKKAKLKKTETYYPSYLGGYIFSNAYYNHGIFDTNKFMVSLYDYKYYNSIKTSKDIRLPLFDTDTLIPDSIDETSKRKIINDLYLMKYESVSVQLRDRHGNFINEYKSYHSFNANPLTFFLFTALMENMTTHVHYMTMSSSATVKQGETNKRNKASIGVSIDVGEFNKALEHTTKYKREGINYDNMKMPLKDGKLRTMVLDDFEVDFDKLAEDNQLIKNVVKYVKTESHFNGAAFMPLEVYAAMAISLNEWSKDKEEAYWDIIKGRASKNAMDVFLQGKSNKVLITALKTYNHTFILNTDTDTSAQDKYCIIPIHENMFDDQVIDKENQVLIHLYRFMIKAGVHVLTTASGSKQDTINIMSTRKDKKPSFIYDDKTNIYKFEYNLERIDMYSKIAHETPLVNYRLVAATSKKRKQETYINVKALIFSWVLKNIDNNKLDNISEALKLLLPDENMIGDYIGVAELIHKQLQSFKGKYDEKQIKQIIDNTQKETINAIIETIDSIYEKRKDISDSLNKTLGLSIDNLEKSDLDIIRKTIKPVLMEEFNDEKVADEYISMVLNLYKMGIGISSLVPANKINKILNSTEENRKVDGGMKVVMPIVNNALALNGESAIVSNRGKIMITNPDHVIAVGMTGLFVSTYEYKEGEEISLMGSLYKIKNITNIIPASNNLINIVKDKLKLDINILPGTGIIESLSEEAKVSLISQVTGLDKEFVNGIFKGEIADIDESIYLYEVTRADNTFTALHDNVVRKYVAKETLDKLDDSSVFDKIVGDNDTVVVYNENLILPLMLIKGFAIDYDKVLGKKMVMFSVTDSEYESKLKTKISTSKDPELSGYYTEYVTDNAAVMRATKYNLKTHRYLFPSNYTYSDSSPEPVITKSNSIILRYDKTGKDYYAGMLANHIVEKGYDLFNINSELVISKYISDKEEVKTEGVKKLKLMKLFRDILETYEDKRVNILNIKKIVLGYYGYDVMEHLNDNSIQGVSFAEQLSATISDIEQELLENEEMKKQYDSMVAVIRSIVDDFDIVSKDVISLFREVMTDTGISDEDINTYVKQLSDVVNAIYDSFSIGAIADEGKFLDGFFNNKNISTDVKEKLLVLLLKSMVGRLNTYTNGVYGYKVSAKPRSKIAKELSFIKDKRDKPYVEKKLALTNISYDSNYWHLFFIPKPISVNDKKVNKLSDTQILNTGLLVHAIIYQYSDEEINTLSELETDKVNAMEDILKTIKGINIKKDDNGSIDLMNSSVYGVPLQLWFEYGKRLAEVSGFVGYRVPVQTPTSLRPYIPSGILFNIDEVMTDSSLIQILKGEDADFDKNTIHNKKYYLKVDMKDIKQSISELLKSKSITNKQVVKELLKYAVRYKADKTDVLYIDGKKLLTADNITNKKFTDVVTLLLYLTDNNRTEVVDDFEKIKDREKINNRFVGSLIKSTRIYHPISSFPITSGPFKRTVELFKDTTLGRTYEDAMSNHEKVQNTMKTGTQVGPLVFIQNEISKAIYAVVANMNHTSEGINGTVDITKDDTYALASQYMSTWNLVGAIELFSALSYDKELVKDTLNTAGYIINNDAMWTLLKTRVNNADEVRHKLKSKYDNLIKSVETAKDNYDHIMWALKYLPSFVMEYGDIFYLPFATMYYRVKFLDDASYNVLYKTGEKWFNYNEYKVNYLYSYVKEHVVTMYENLKSKGILTDINIDTFYNTKNYLGLLNATLKSLIPDSKVIEYKVSDYMNMDTILKANNKLLDDILEALVKLDKTRFDNTEITDFVLMLGGMVIFKDNVLILSSKYSSIAGSVSWKAGASEQKFMKGSSEPIMPSEFTVVRYMKHLLGVNKEQSLNAGFYSNVVTTYTMHNIIGSYYKDEHLGIVKDIFNYKEIDGDIYVRIEKDKSKNILASDKMEASERIKTILESEHVKDIEGISYINITKLLKDKSAYIVDIIYKAIVYSASIKFYNEMSDKFKSYENDDNKKQIFEEYTRIADRAANDTKIFRVLNDIENKRKEDIDYLSKDGKFNIFPIYLYSMDTKTYPEKEILGVTYRLMLLNLLDEGMISYDNYYNLLKQLNSDAYNETSNYFNMFGNIKVSTYSDVGENYLAMTKSDENIVAKAIANIKKVYSNRGDVFLLYNYMFASNIVRNILYSRFAGPLLSENRELLNTIVHSMKNILSAQRYLKDDESFKPTWGINLNIERTTHPATKTSRYYLNDISVYNSNVVKLFAVNPNVVHSITNANLIRELSLGYYTKLSLQIKKDKSYEKSSMSVINDFNKLIDKFKEKVQSSLSDHVYMLDDINRYSRFAAEISKRRKYSKTSDSQDIEYTSSAIINKSFIKGLNQLVIRQIEVLKENKVYDEFVKLLDEYIKEFKAEYNSRPSEIDNHTIFMLWYYAKVKGDKSMDKDIMTHILNTKHINTYNDLNNILNEEKTDYMYKTEGDIKPGDAGKLAPYYLFEFIDNPSEKMDYIGMFFGNKKNAEDIINEKHKKYLDKKARDYDLYATDFNTIPENIENKLSSFDDLINIMADAYFYYYISKSTGENQYGMNNKLIRQNLTNNKDIDIKQLNRLKLQLLSIGLISQFDVSYVKDKSLTDVFNVFRIGVYLEYATKYLPQEDLSVFTDSILVNQIKDMIQDILDKGNYRVANSKIFNTMYWLNDVMGMSGRRIKEKVSIPVLLSISEWLLNTLRSKEDMSEVQRADFYNNIMTLLISYMTKNEHKVIKTLLDNMADTLGITLQDKDNKMEFIASEDNVDNILFFLKTLNAYKNIYRTTDIWDITVKNISGISETRPDIVKLMEDYLYLQNYNKQQINKCK